MFKKRWLWIDDLREPNRNFEFWAKTAKEAIEILKSKDICFISFDHDLGSEDPDKSGYAIAKWIENEASEGRIGRLEWNVHSTNPVGASNIREAMAACERTWDFLDSLISTKVDPVESVFCLERIKYEGSNFIGSEIYFNEVGLFKTFDAAKLFMKNLPVGEKSDFDLFFRITEMFFISTEIRSRVWRFDTAGDFVDGTTVIQAEVSKNIEGQQTFSENEIVAVIIDGSIFCGVIRGRSISSHPKGGVVEEFDVQTAVTTENGDSYRRWVEKPLIWKLSNKDISDHYLYRLAMWCLNGNVLRQLTGQVRHLTHYPKKWEPPTIPGDISLALEKYRSGIDEIFFEIKKTVLYAPGWDCVDSKDEIVGGSFSFDGAVDRIKKSVSKDQNADWTFSSGNPTPYPLVLSYSINPSRINGDGDDLNKPYSETKASPWEFVWSFNRKGDCIGVDEISCRPFTYIKQEECIFHIGDIVSMRQTKNVRRLGWNGKYAAWENTEITLSPAIIVSMPPSQDDKPIGYDMSDNEYTVKNGSFRKDLHGDHGHFPEGKIRLYEAEVTDNQKLRLARLLAPRDTVNAIKEKFFFGKELNT